MNVVFLTLFVSLVLVALAVLMLAWSVRQRDHEHTDRLALLPLRDDAHPTLVHPEHRP